MCVCVCVTAVLVRIRMPLISQRVISMVHEHAHRHTSACILPSPTSLHTRAYPDGFWVSYEPTPLELEEAGGDWWAAHKLTSHTVLEEFDETFCEDGLQVRACVVAHISVGGAPTGEGWHGRGGGDRRVTHKGEGGEDCVQER